MIWLYIAAAIFGGAFLVPMLLGGVDLDNEVDFDTGPELDADFDTGADFDTSTDLDADLDGADLDSAAESTDLGRAGSSAVGDLTAGLLSFRSLVFFSAFFGLSGIVFDSLGFNGVVTFLTAVVLGVIAALAHSAVFGMVRRSQTDSTVSNRQMEGRPAHVVLPLTDGHKGRIRLDINGQPHFLVALPFQAGADQQFDVGTSVVVVEIENGTALVAPLDLDLGEEQ